MIVTAPDSPALRRFARLDAALTALAELAAGPAAGRLPELLAGDDLALALMRAGADVVREAGMPVDLDAGHWTTGHLGDAALLSRAVRWQAYAGGPVSEVHGACGRAIARGLLRVWARRQGITTGGAAARGAGLRQARVRLLGRIRTRCAALRAELRAAAAALPHRRGAAFEAYVGRRVSEVARELSQAAEWEFERGFGDPGAPGRAAAIHRADEMNIDPPAAGSARLENRLTMLLGAGFGTGAALAAARVAGEALPASGPVAAAAAAIAGTVLGGALVRTRRLLVRRAVLDRWVIEVTAQLRAELEERVVVLALAAEAARVGRSTGPGSAGFPIGDTGDYRPASRRR